MLLVSLSGVQVGRHNRTDKQLHAHITIHRARVVTTYAGSGDNPTRLAMLLEELDQVAQSARNAALKVSMLLSTHGIESKLLYIQQFESSLGNSFPCLWYLRPKFPFAGLHLPDFSFHLFEVLFVTYIFMYVVGYDTYQLGRIHMHMVAVFRIIEDTGTLSLEDKR